MKVVFASLFLMTALCVFAASQQTQPQTQTQTQTQPQTSSSLSPKISPILEAQIWLARKNYSPGEIDGTLGKNMKMALDVYRQDHNLPGADKVDDQTLNSLREQGVDPLTTYKITDEDANGPFVKTIPKEYTAQAQLESLGYTSELEALGEKFHCSPALLKKLNRKSNFGAGSEIIVPNVASDEQQQTAGNTNQTQPVQRVSGKKAQKPESPSPTNSVVVTKEKSQLTVQDPDGKTIFVAPITAGSDEEPYPFGSWKVKGVSWNPHYEYDPAVLKDPREGKEKAKLPPGPNSPVGVVWIELSAPHYGIHGTPDPGRIGYTESHGCIRLTNWDAVKVAHLVKFGTPVTFQ